MAAPRKIDWERIEPGWREGIKSVLQLAEEYASQTGVSVSHTAINSHFKTLGIPRDLSAKVQAKAAAMLSAAMLSGNVSTETKVSEAEIINRSASDVARILLSHRKDVSKMRSKIDALLAELESCGEDLSKRASILKTLSDTQKTLIWLERQAFNIPDAPDDSATRHTHSHTIDVSKMSIESLAEVLAARGSNANSR